ncbi:MAG TPA: mycofactocin precursor MftA [Acidimicrobiales bacterium]|nr:mycofactocin precursor MftA [Acidimicrobiales bacterium]
MPEAVCELDSALHAGAPSAPPVGPAAGSGQAADLLVLDDVLVEEISIDGMCGVY